MKAIGFNFSKISAEKLDAKKGKNLKINAEMDVSDITKVDSKLLKGKEEVVKVEFKYVINYKPDFAKVDLAGSILFSMDPKKSKKILKEWKKKKLADEFKIGVFNLILKKSSLKALELEDDLNLPYHMPMPSFKEEKK